MKVCLLDEAPQALVVDDIKKVCTNASEEKHLREFANLLGIDVFDVSQGGKLPAVVSEVERQQYEGKRMRLDQFMHLRT